MRLRHLLVTGGAGFVGSAFVRQRLTVDPELRITVLDKLTYAGSEENLSDFSGDRRLEFVRGDVRDRVVVDRLARDVDGIVNFAAESHVDRSLIDAGAFVQTNVEGTSVLLDAAVRYRHQRFLQVSTDEVYGHVKEGRSGEDDRLRPRSPYAASKAAAEMLAMAAHASFGLPVIITRGSNTYGPFQFPEKIVPLFITNAIDNLPLPIYGKGTAVRDYLYVEDHVEGIARVLWKGDPGAVYNLGLGTEVSGEQVADRVLELCGKPPSLKRFTNDRKGHDYRYALETRRVRPLGWQARYSFEEGLRRTVDWYRGNEAWWRKRKSEEFWSFYRQAYPGLPTPG